MPARNRAIAYAEHLAIAERLWDALQPRLSEPRERPLLLGICGAQGSGKSTLTETIAHHFRDRGRRVAQLSLDDLYLRRSEREELAATIHPLLATRGVPGTHDVGLGEDVFDRLTLPGLIRIPRFDKAIDDRFPEDQWDEAEGPVDLILFEGWCVGAKPQSETALAEPINALERDEDPDGRWRRYVNAMLAGDYQHLFSRIDMLILLAAPSFDIVAQWRTEQEEALRKKLIAEGRQAGGGLMTAPQIARFIQYYERLTRHILSEMPSRADMLVRLGPDRGILAS